MPTATAVICYVAGYIVLIGFFVIERFVRQGEHTKDMSRGRFDRGSTTLISIAMGVAFVVVPLAPLWNWLRIGPLLNVWVAVAGILLGLGGLVIRYAAFSTLGRFFTRTLRQQSGHQLVTTGIYRRIRHPGYLSDIMIFVGVSLAMLNLVVLLIVIVMFIPAYAHRIRVEEQMLVEVFGQEYVAYQQTSKRLIPGVL